MCYKVTKTERERVRACVRAGKGVGRVHTTKPRRRGEPESKEYPEDSERRIVKEDKRTKFASWDSETPTPGNGPIEENTL